MQHNQKGDGTIKSSSMSLNGQLVKLADCPSSWSPEKVAEYRMWGQKLLDALHGTNPQMEEKLQDSLRLGNLSDYGTRKVRSKLF